MQIQEIYTILKKNKIKVTPGVKQVITAFLSHDMPVSVLQVRNATSKNIATVYRIIGRLTAAGILKQLQFNEQKSFYELNRQAHHHHFVCDSCNIVMDIAFEEGNTLSDAKQSLAEAYNIQVAGHEINFHGTCKQCSNVGKTT